MRLFLAIDIPAQSKKEISEQIQSLKKEYPDLIWVSEENYHLTLHFFGEKSKDEVPKIKKAMEQILFDTPQFHLYAFFADLFIDQRILIYMGFRREKTLEEIELRIRDRFQSPQRGKDFVPHVTLARYRIPSKQQYLLLKKKIQKLSIEASFKVTKIHLFESILTGKTPTYRKLASFALPTS